MDLLLQVFPVEDLAALGIDQVALLVHDVVIFQHALTRLEVAALHGLLGLLDRTGEHLGVQRRILFHLERVHHAHNTLRTEQTHDVIRHGEIEAALTRVALSAGTAAQLVVDSAAFMPLGTENEEPTGRLDLFGLGRGYRTVFGHFFSKQTARRLDRLIIGLGIAGRLRDDGIVIAGLFQIVLGQVFRVAAEHDVGAAAGHVGRDGDGAELARLGDDLGFLFMILGVQDRMRDAALAQQRGEVLALLDADRTDQNRLSLFMAFGDLVDDGAVLADIAAVDHIGPVVADDGLVGRDLDDIQLVDGGKFLGLGHSRAGHARELVIKAEIVLEGDRREGLVFLLDIHMLLRLDGLVQAFGVAAAEHQAAGKLIDDDDLAVLDDIVDVALHDAVRTQSLVDVVTERSVFHVGEILETEGRLGFFDAARGQGSGLRLFVHDIVGVKVLALLFLLIHGGVDNPLQPRHKIVRLTVEIGALIPLSGDDQRRSRLVNQDRVHLVHNRKGVTALDHVLFIQGHVVTQIVKAHLVVGAVGDVAGIGLTPFFICQAVDDQAHGKTEEAVYLAHPLAVTACQIVVDRDDVDALARQCVQIGRQNGDQRLAFTGLHLGDSALMQDDAADDLYREGLHPQDAPGRLPCRRKGIGENIVQCFTVCKALLQLVSFAAQLFIGQGGILRFPVLDRLGNRHDSFQFSVGIAAEQLGKKSHLNLRGINLLRPRPHINSILKYTTDL